MTVAWQLRRSFAQDLFFVVDIGGDADVGGIGAGGMDDGADAGLAVAAIDHHAFYGLAKLVGSAIVAGGEFAGGAIEVGLAPDLGGTVIEEVEVVGVVAFLLHDLQLEILIIDDFAVGWGTRFRKSRFGTCGGVFYLHS
jgi:hypothetical protein